MLSISMYHTSDGNYFYCIFLAASDQIAEKKAVELYLESRGYNDEDGDEKQWIKDAITTDLYLERLPDVCYLSYKRQEIQSYTTMVCEAGTMKMIGE